MGKRKKPKDDKENMAVDVRDKEARATVPQVYNCFVIRFKPENELPGFTVLLNSSAQHSVYKENGSLIYTVRPEHLTALNGAGVPYEIIRKS